MALKRVPLTLPLGMDDPISLMDERVSTARIHTLVMDVVRPFVSTQQPGEEYRKEQSVSFVLCTCDGGVNLSRGGEFLFPPFYSLSLLSFFHFRIYEVLGFESDPSVSGFGGKGFCTDNFFLWVFIGWKDVVGIGNYAHMCVCGGESACLFV